MVQILEAQSRDLETKLNNLRDKLDSVSDNNYFEQNRIKAEISNTINKLSETKKAIEFYQRQKR